MDYIEKQQYFAGIFAELDIPVVVCANTPALPVEYMNIQAGLLFTPSYSADRRSGEATLGSLSGILRFFSGEEDAVFHSELREMHRVSAFPCTAVTAEGREFPVRVSGNGIQYRQPDDHIAFYLLAPEGRSRETAGRDRHITDIINVSFLAETDDEAIQTVLAMAGRQSDVSRVYIFEEVSPATTRNTYEWCAPGVQPAIQDLQNLDKADYPYDEIISAGMFITDDVGALPSGDRDILEAQGILSLAIIPIVTGPRAIGYVGFDDCRKARRWTTDETLFLQSVAGLLATLLRRRDAERSAQSSRLVLQSVADNLDDIIYVNDLNDYRLLFVSRSLAELLGVKPEELIGQRCWEAFQFEENGPCSFCPIPKVELEPGQERSRTYVWEHYNKRVGKHYLIKDMLMRWTDGRTVHMEAAIDITERLRHEEDLRYYATIDVMTGAYNRVWGARVLEEKLADPATAGSLVFLDVDGLKRVNDTLGHTMGDRMLREIIEMVRRRLPADALLCRWGGDEFIVCMDLTEAAAGELIGRIQADITALNEQEGRDYQMQFSFGIVPFVHGEGGTLDAVVTEADTRMYRNKIERRGLRRRREDQ